MWRVQPTVAGTNLGLRSKRKQDEQVMMRKPISNIPPWLLHQLLPPSPCPVPVLQWVTTTTCILVMVFHCGHTNPAKTNTIPTKHAKLESTCDPSWKYRKLKPKWTTWKIQNKTKPEYSYSVVLSRDQLSWSKNCCYHCQLQKQRVLFLPEALWELWLRAMELYLSQSIRLKDRTCSMLPLTEPVVQHCDAS